MIVKFGEKMILRDSQLAKVESRFSGNLKNVTGITLMMQELVFFFAKMVKHMIFVSMLNFEAISEKVIFLLLS